MMPVRQKRKKTAKEVAKHFGVSERTVRRHVAEERDTYEARADYRRNLAGNMREQGKSWAEIAAAISAHDFPCSRMFPARLRR
ncbi:DeoR family transcriptional regulator [Stenotrophomonas maltophilia]|uniref:DeoR family transcriptional regulator n=1 Tax=Stenotrophomonas maltophilia TaxID=40324 RepID=UPI0013DBC2C7|nr:HTH domain-containing protein [Stenotrophomonas maltophilia]